MIRHSFRRFILLIVIYQYEAHIFKLNADNWLQPAPNIAKFIMITKQFILITVYNIPEISIYTFSFDFVD